MQPFEITLSGWFFPPAFAADGGQIRTTTGPDSIKQALKVLFVTKIGERLNHPTYGCDLDSFLFEQVSSQVIINIENTVLDAIRSHEPRVVNPTVTVTESADEGERLYVKVAYALRETGQQQDLTLALNLLGQGGFDGF